MQRKYNKTPILLMIWAVVFITALIVCTAIYIAQIKYKQVIVNPTYVIFAIATFFIITVLILIKIHIWTRNTNE